MPAMIVNIFLLLATTSMLQGGLAVNILAGGNGLIRNQYLNNGDYYLVLQEDCDLVMYHGSLNGSVTWHSNSACSAAPRGACSLNMQSDGNLVIHNDSYPTNFGALWAEPQQASTMYTDYFLILLANGSFQIYNFGSESILTYTLYPDMSSTSKYCLNATTNVSRINPIQAQLPSFSVPGRYPVFLSSYMPSDYTLYVGNSSLQSGSYNLTLGEDCNLRSMHSSGVIVWETNTNQAGPSPNCRLTLQQNGKLTILNDNSEVVWESNGAGSNLTNWILYLDSRTGSVSVIDILQQSTSIWTTGTYLMSRHQSRFSLTWLLVGLFSGGALLGFVPLALVYRTCGGGIDPAEKELQDRLRNQRGNCQALTFAKIQEATNNFETKIGEGGFGGVFYGRLDDGQEVAVKVLSATSKQSKEELFNEIELLSMVNYKYLVSLVGYCLSKDHQILVYDYVKGGDLRRRLHGKSSPERSLSWQQRTNIILQIAQGIDYMHDKCQQVIIHRDVKSNNILLTESLIAKVADFGLSKLKASGQENATHITTNVKGTPGYLDPEYYESGLLTEKSDVYAFGVVLMEILTAQSPVAIIERVSQAWRSNQMIEVADPNLHGDFNQQEFLNIAKLSLWCVMRTSINRPSMLQVVQTLRNIGLAEVGPILQSEANGDRAQILSSSSLMPFALLSSDSDFLFEEDSNPLLLSSGPTPSRLGPQSVVANYPSVVASR